jgi:hypothetical protein
VLQLVRQETEIVLTHGRNPIARVISIVEQAEAIASAEADEVIARPPRKLGLHPGAMKASEDFDEALPDEFWLGTDEVASCIAAGCG